MEIWLSADGKLEQTQYAAGDSGMLNYDMECNSEDDGNIVNEDPWNEDNDMECMSEDDGNIGNEDLWNEVEESGDEVTFMEENLCKLSTDVEDECYSAEDSEISEDEFVEESSNRGKRGRPFGSTKHPGNDADEPQRKKKKSNLVTLCSLTYTICCTMLCISGIDYMTLETTRKNFQSLGKTEKSQFILDWLQSHSRINEETGKYEFRFVIGTATVCLSAFLMVLGIPASTYYSIRKMFYDGASVIGNAGNRIGRMKAASQVAITWLHMYAIEFGEKLPDQPKIHLPPCMTKYSVYEDLSESVKSQGEEVISLSHFYFLWRTCMCHIAIPKASRFSKCNKCTNIKTKLAETRNKDLRGKLLKKRDKHLKQQNAERRKYYKHAQKAKTSPDQYLSVIIDAMDQSKTQLPHFLYASKFTSSMWKLKVHLVGLILHGIGIYGFFDIFEYPHSANLTISTLINIFSMIEDLPPILYLQMDNCFRENKNRYVLGFMTLLVELGIFTKVKISFLMVGHTHEDIDQVFSRFSTWLSRKAVLTLSKLMTGFENCTTPSPTSIRTTEVWDVAGWLTKSLNKISNHSYPHMFKIEKLNGKTTLFYKKWSTDKIWSQITEPLLLKIPTDKPEQVVPSLTKLDISKLENDVNTSFSYFKREEDKQWWGEFFEELKNIESSTSEASWPLDILIKNAKKRKDRMHLADEEDTELTDLSDEDEPIPPIIVGTKKTNTAKNHTVTVGEMVLLDLKEYSNEWPQLAQLTEITETNGTCTIHWYKGAKSTSWKPCSKPVKGKKGKREPWIVQAETSDIIFGNFELTKGGHLPKLVKDFCTSYVRST